MMSLSSSRSMISPSRELAPYPLTEPHATGMLDVGDGHCVYWEECGNPSGVPVVYLHGGPGAGCAPVHRTFFDPTRYRIIVFDQRGAGRSTPYAEIRANTTDHLIADLEKLRGYHGIDRWLLFGGSWGSTLALVYAQTHSQRVLGCILRGVFLFTHREVDWFLYGMENFFPEHASHLYAHASPEEGETVLDAMYRSLCHPDPKIHEMAADIWAEYEDVCARMTPSPFLSSVRREDGQHRHIALARLEAHYMVNAGFLEEGQILRNMPLIRHIPCHIIQGRHDVVCPPKSAYMLHDAWPGSRLIMVPDGGHAAMENSVRSALIAATDLFATFLRPAS